MFLTTPRPERVGPGGLYDRLFDLSTTTPAPLKTVVYIDGFNFYYGALKGTCYKWLDLARFFQILRPGDNI